MSKDIHSRCIIFYLLNVGVLALIKMPKMEGLAILPPLSTDCEDGLAWAGAEGEIFSKKMLMASCPNIGRVMFALTG